MSAASRQQTCAACGRALPALTDLEPLIDKQIRYVAVCHGCSTFVHRKKA